MEKAHNREEMLASIPSIKPVRIDLLNKNLNALSGYGIRLHPVYIKWTECIPALILRSQRDSNPGYGDGVVVKADHEGIGYGNHIIIDHGFGYSSLYGHMSSYIVKVGDKIHKGQTIGYVGQYRYFHCPTPSL
jgi:murein DD-endopeptidase MepM/ murein hydrolase activator NlpD